MEFIKIVGPLILAFIMFSLGVGLSIKDFERVIKQPKDFFVGAFSQVILFPIFALTLALVFPIPLELKVGLILLAAAPGGVTTNIISKFADGDVALSISLTSVISLLSFLTIPIVFSLTYPIISGESLPFDYSIGNVIIQIFLITTVPVIIGMISRVLFLNFFLRVEKLFVKASFVLFLIFLITAIYKELNNILHYFALSGMVTLILNIAVIIGALFLCRIFKIQNKQKRTILIETDFKWNFGACCYRYHF